VIGQNEAIDKISKAIRRNRTGIREGKRPIGSFMFLGSTGIGKTHLAKAIASELFGDASSLIRVDMSEYTEKFTTSRLIGSPPGYVGYNEGGQLTESVRNKPYSVILFDEIEKAHGDVFNLLLQILEDGHLTDGSGRKVNFKNTLIIMTSNVGAKKSQDFSNKLGFATTAYSGTQEEHKKEIIKKELKSTFKPEFINRIDEVVFFNPLKIKDVKQITKLELNKLISRLQEMDYNISYETSVVTFITKEGFDETFGARPIRRTIQDKIEDFISEEVLRNNIETGVSYVLQMDDKKENVIIVPKN
jgi:ATP-dependent Clp protease ATP-binding subunit ClpC